MEKSIKLRLLQKAELEKYGVNGDPGVALKITGLTSYNLLVFPKFVLRNVLPFACAHALDTVLGCLALGGACLTGWVLSALSCYTGSVCFF